MTIFHAFTKVTFKESFSYYSIDLPIFVKSL